MNAPAATVVIATFQRREMVRGAVDSVLAQTRADFELVVVDDGSTDGTDDSLAGLDPRLRVVPRGHEGHAAARNAGVHIARGPVVAFLDSDDRWRPDHLATVLDALALHPEAVLASTCRRVVVRGARPTARPIVRNVLAESLLSNHTGLPSCIAVRRGALEAVGGFDQTLVGLEDDDTWARLAAIGPFVFVDRGTVIRNDSPGSLGKQSARAGAKLVALERQGTRAAARLSRTPELQPLARRATAASLLARALAALDAGDDGACHELLVGACELEPGLHDQAELLSFRIGRYLPSVNGLNSYALACARCATVWPDQRASTAHWLRTQALLSGIRARRAAPVAAALRGWRPSGSSRLIRRAGGRLAGRARQLL